MRAALLAAFPRFVDIIYNRRRDARELEQKRLFVGVSHEIRERTLADRDAARVVVLFKGCNRTKVSLKLILIRDGWRIIARY